MKVAELLAEARRSLGLGPAAAIEAEALLGHVLGRARAWLFANGEHAVTSDEAKRFLALLRRRLDGEPVAYLTGEREFWSLRLQVSPDVLIPRAETELLVETALEAIPSDAAWRVADVGTGSGAVAIAIAHERPLCEVHASDISEAALAVARENARTLVPGRIHFHRGSWLEPLAGRFRVIVSNPPYVAEGDPHLQRGDCRFEPRLALAAGPDGMASIKPIASQARQALEHAGLLAFEHGFEQGKTVRDLLGSLGYRELVTLKDLQGLERVTRGIWP